MKKLVLVLLFVIALSTVPVGENNVFAQSTPRFTFAPGGDLGARLNFTDVSPGETVSGMLRVALLDNVQTVFEISYMDAVRRSLSSLGVAEESLGELSIADNMDFPYGQKFALRGQEVFEFPFNIKLPEGISPGDYKGLFTVTILGYGSNLDVDTILAGGEEGLGMGTKIVVGVGVEMFMRIMGEFVPNLVFQDLDYVVMEDGSLKVLVNYFNDGNISIIPSAHILVTDIFGRRYFNKDYKFPLISPGVASRSAMVVSLDDFFLGYGVYNFDVELTYDVYNLETGAAVIYSSGFGRLKIYSFPWFIFLGIALILVLILGYIFYRNIRFITLYRCSKEYLVKERDTLQGVSNRFKVDPKKIIYVNKLKKPYFLEGGSKILIPKKDKDEKK